MKSSNRKGNWNEIAGTLKHRRAKPVVKVEKNDKEEDPLEHPRQKSGKTSSEQDKLVVKSLGAVVR
jgi:hypothetical protein